MEDIWIREDGHAGRITLQRPKALNALTYDMVRQIEGALDAWRDADVALVLIDADGDKAFCAGGDIADMYASGQRGDLGYGRQFWRDEYRLNAKIFEYPKPVVSLLQGFTMGGGVGVGCHGSHRVVGESSQIAMPECGIGLVPDVGGSLMLARAPGRLGAYLGITSARMGPADAIHAGFADHFIPQAAWPELCRTLAATGQTGAIEAAATPPPDGTLRAAQARIDQLFAPDGLAAIHARLAADETEVATAALHRLRRNAPLAMACCLEILDQLQTARTIRTALELEFRYTYRAVAQGDFIEGIRAAIIDRDRAPQWAHGAMDVPKEEVAAMLAPLGTEGLNWEEMP
jgi:enoyl-CoA hydratase/carnithine racemase